MRLACSGSTLKVHRSIRGMSSSTLSATDYLDENTYTPPPVHFHRVVLSRSDARKAHVRHLEKQLGLFMVSKWEKRAERFKQIEEAKWEGASKKKKAPKQPVQAAVAGEGVPVVSGKEKSERVAALLEKLKDSDSGQVLLPTYSEELFALAQNEGPTHSRIGVTGLNHAYFAEDFGAFRHKGQLYDGVFGKEEEEGSRVQTQAKLRGMLVEHKLLPSMDSGLWETDDVSKWNEWALHEKDLPQSEAGKNKSQWEQLNADEVAEVVAGVITESWAPGTRSASDSAAEWKRREELAKKIQATRNTARSLPIEWISKTFVEPNWTEDDAKRRWRERKVVLKVRLDALGLSPVVRARLESVLGPRYENGVAKVVADKYETKEENRLYSLLLFRSLLTDAFESDPKFVRVNETRKDLLKQHNTALRDAIARQANNPHNVLFSVRFQ